MLLQNPDTDNVEMEQTGISPSAPSTCTSITVDAFVERDGNCDIRYQPGVAECMFLMGLTGMIQFE